MAIKPGVELLGETVGDGPPVLKHKHYQLRLRMWLRRGDAVRWPKSPGLEPVTEDDGATLTTDVRVDRVRLVAGLFYGIQGMRVGGTRTLRIAPHLAYGERGIPGVIPANAVVTVEVTVLSDRPELDY